MVKTIDGICILQEPKMHADHVIPSGSEADKDTGVNQTFKVAGRFEEHCCCIRRLITRGADHVKNNCYQKQCCCGVNENVHDHELTSMKEEVPVRR